MNTMPCSDTSRGKLCTRCTSLSLEVSSASRRETKMGLEPCTDTGRWSSPVPRTKALDTLVLPTPGPPKTATGMVPSSTRSMADIFLGFMSFLGVLSGFLFKLKKTFGARRGHG